MCLYGEKEPISRSEESAGKKEKKHRANVDAVAATLLLEGYLASPNR